MRLNRQKHLDSCKAFAHYRIVMKLKRVCPLLALVSVLCVGVFAAFATAQINDAHPVENSMRAQAFDLYQHGRFVDAMPLFEQLSADNPNDVAVKERLAWCVMSNAGTLTDEGARKQARIRARKLAVEAKAMGDNSQILQVILELPEDGSDPVYSPSKEVDDTMRAAEASFSRGDFDQAIVGYMKVIQLDPNNYSAPLFLGDVYYKQNSYDKAGEWFAKAIQIDPNRETAYRYWGDTLARAGKNDEARTKFIEAIVAEPYDRRSWVGITNWLQANHLTINYVRLKDGSSVAAKDDLHVNVTIDNSLQKDDANMTAWLAYGVARASWRGDKFKKEFPNEPQYRQTMKEESDSLSMMITVLKEGKHYQDTYNKLDPSLQSLIKIQELGFLDPFVLLNRANADIAKDYEPYRVAHRDMVQRYLSEYVVPPTPAVVQK